MEVGSVCVSRVGDASGGAVGKCPTGFLGELISLVAFFRCLLFLFRRLRAHAPVSPPPMVPAGGQFQSKILSNNHDNQIITSHIITHKSFPRKVFRLCPFDGIR